MAVIAIVALSVIAGISLAGLAFAVYSLSVKAVKFAQDIRSGIATLKTLNESSHQVVVELRLLRTMMEATAQPQVYQTADPDEYAQPRPRAARMPFPNPYQDMYPTVPVPDAKPEETEISETTDEGAAQREKIEEVRQMGYEADPAELDEQ